MPKASDLKKGAIVEIDEQLYQVRNIDVRSPSSRGANTLYKITFMNIQKKQKLEQTLGGTDFLKEADCMRRMLQFLYKDEQFYTFMDNEDYNQYTLSIEEIDNAADYLPDGQEGILGMLYEDNLIGIELPASVSLKIIETAPAIKGASASARTKPAELETGLVVQVPEYLAEGEVIRVITATGKFAARA
ncbi:elongation factor P-like protein EfpL [sulfur-oxidizing endosymbiont of Gigantopelta aegis]|uniref:elongation factor P-like protein EfpL n=1 Tax=sulfur-oxidizing endosymbiont of Gigantopelta aegis TaxID=2794934 RepID=UPI0018DB9C12|nr:elongation factor P-like protein YeiP [sulfur-oxidizing endosymbiont of Gigantopelta aegis]